MSITPILSRITIFPVKSLDGIALQKAMISEGGCLMHDREYAITDAEGNPIIGKTNPLVHSLRSSVNFEKEEITFQWRDEVTWHRFHLHEERQEIQSYLSEFFGMPVILHQDKHGRFLDIPDISGATILSTASLKSISNWFNNMEIEETRKRFRATLEIEGVPAFWEDKLFTEKGSAIEFNVGDVTMYGMSPRERCVVPTRNPESGEIFHAFPKFFTRQRAKSLPEWSMLKEYKNHYYLTVNCYIPETEIGKWIHIGDEIIINGKKRFT